MSQFGAVKYRELVTPGELHLKRREVNRYQWALRMLPPAPAIIVELGCGSGFGAHLFGENGHTVIAFDPDKKTRAFARKNWSHPNVTYKNGTVKSFLFENMQVDAIVCMEVLEHMPDGRKLAQMLTNQANTVVISTPYKEPINEFCRDHWLHGLVPADFPGFEVQYQYADGTCSNVPPETYGTMLMRWERTWKET